MKTLLMVFMHSSGEGVLGGRSVKSWRLGTSAWLANVQPLLDLIFKERGGRDTSRMADGGMGSKANFPGGMFDRLFQNPDGIRSIGVEKSDAAQERYSNIIF
jgi:hypothetical protein